MPAGLSRIAVIGVTGCGKTSLARRLSVRFGVPHTELDALHWEPNWAEAPNPVFRDRTSRALAGDAWVADGNYSEVRDIVWSRTTAVVWLDYPLWTIMARLLWRTLRRIVTNEVLWNGNRERVLDQFMSRDSILLYALKTFKRRRREYPLLFRRPEYSHLKVVRLRSPRAARRWLSGLIRVSCRD